MSEPQMTLQMFCPPKEGHVIKSTFAPTDSALCLVRGVKNRVWLPVSEIPYDCAVYAIEVISIN